MSRYINPFTDFGFKKIFGEEASKDIIIDFLNSLNIHEHKITDISFRKTEYLGNSSLDRKAFFDLYCIDTLNNKFIVELQRVEQKYFKDRSLYYTSFAIQEQAQQGDWDYQLTGVYFIGILDFKIINNQENNNYKHSVMLVETETNQVFYDKLKYIYLEIPKFNKTEEQLETILDKWLYFLKYLSSLENIPNQLNSEVFIKAFQIAEMINMGKEQQLEYQASLKSYRDLKVVMDQKFEQGKIAGEAIGIEKGELRKTKALLINILSKKLSHLEPEILNKIDSIQDINTVDKLIDQSFEVTDPQQLNKILDEIQ